MSKNIGTLISAPIRPNDSLDLISSALAREIQGGLHSVENLTQRNQIYTVRREWGMLVSVYNDGANTGYYTLTKNLSSENLADNGNWEKLDLGKSKFWLDPAIKFVYDPSNITSPSIGDRFIVGTPSTGIFASHSGEVAIFNGTGYTYETPENGSVILNLDLNTLYYYTDVWPNGDWDQLSGGTSSGGGGTSGTSGQSGTSGTSGEPGTSGTSGQSGTSGTSGNSSYIIFQDSPTIGFVTSSSGSDIIVSANIFTGSIDPSYLNIGANPGPTSGYVLSTDESGNFEWVQQSTGGFTLSVIDYNTGETFSGVQNIIFRGGVVTVPTGGGTATAVGVLGTPPTVTVWIPLPNYAPYFSPTLFTSTTDRFISFPDGGFFNVGDWSPSSDFSSNTLRPTTNSTTPILAFTESNFGVYTTGTTMSFTVYDGSGAILSQITNYTINSVGSTGSLGITLSVTSFSADEDRYKASVSGTIDLNTILPNGGRFYYTVYHYNSEGPGNVSSGVYGFSSSNIFYDDDGSSSSITIGGPLDFEEYSNSLVYYSGVAFYKVGQTFSLTASSINLLNDQSFPNSVQLRYNLTNMAVSGNFDAFADGSKSGIGVAITGWNINYNNSGLTYSRLVTVNQTGQYIPGYSTNNTVSTTPSSYINLSYYDWVLAGTTQSLSKLLLFDTLTPASPTYNNDPIESESGRLRVSSITQSGTASFDSTQSLNTTYTDELQYMWGRVIYPQTNFTTYRPLINSGLSVNYTGLTGSVKTFNIFTNLNTNQTTAVTFSGYRWHVTSYTKGGSSFGNGIFTINSNFLESYLDYDFNLLTSGTGDLVILVGIDNTGSNLTPDSFLFISSDPSTLYPGRVEGPIYNLSAASESNKKIKFDKGAGTATVNKVWLLIGYKNTATGKNLRFTNIALA